MNLELEGKRALVTGSTAGIGLATAKLLAAEGVKVIVNGRTVRRVELAIRTIREAVPNADVLGVPADLGTAAGCEEVIYRISNIDILVNNLGVYSLSPFESTSDAEWFRLFETNVMSGVRLSRAYLPGMLKRNWGRIVFISSESALQIPAEMIDHGERRAASGKREWPARRSPLAGSWPSGPKRRVSIRRQWSANSSPPSVLSSPAFHISRGGGGDDRVRVQQSRVGDQRRGAAGGWGVVRAIS